MDGKNNFVEKVSAILVKQGAVTQKESDAMKKDFYNRSKDTFDFFLLDEGLITKKELLKALSEYFQVPAVDLNGLFLDHDLVRNFPKDFLTENVIVPIELDQNIITIAAGNPNAPDLASKIEEIVSYVPEFRVGETQQILDAIDEYYDEPPEGYIRDTTDTDEFEGEKLEEPGIDVLESDEF